MAQCTYTTLLIYECNVTKHEIFKVAFGGIAVTLANATPSIEDGSAKKKINELYAEVVKCLGTRNTIQKPC